jgi:hypothetical protein
LRGWFKDWSRQDKINFLGVIVALLIGVSSVILSWSTSQHTEKIEVSFNQDLNQIKGKIAEYDTIIVRNITSNTANNTIYFPCPNGTSPTMSGDEKGITIKCVKR